MATIWARRAIVAGVMGFAAGSAAAEPSFWVKCDGRPKPEAETSKFGRGLASAATIGLVRSPEVYSATDRAHDLAGVAACDQALDALGDAPETAPRRASLLEARAIHRVEADQSHAALADVEAARRAAGGATGGAGGGGAPIFLRRAASGSVFDEFRRRRARGPGRARRAAG